MSIDINWIQAVAWLVLGFLLKVLFDEVKSVKLRIVGVSKSPFAIDDKHKVIGTGFDNYYTAYRIRVENKQKRYMNCAAENCIAWLELDCAPEPYQICWVGDFADVTINVGDIREVDICARGNTTGTIYAPTERGYFEPSPRTIGDGKSELRGKLRITSKNGKKAEKPFIIKPNNNQLEIKILDRGSKEKDMVDTNSENTKPEDPITKLSKQIEDSTKADWFRFFFGLGFAAVAIGVGIAFSEPASINPFTKSALAIAVLIFGITVITKAGLRYYPERWNKRLANGSIIASSIGSITLLVEGILITEFKGINFNASYFTFPGILCLLIGAILFYYSMKSSKKSMK